MSRYGKELKDKLDDEIKLAGLEALVPEEHEKHLILNSNRLRTLRMRVRRLRRTWRRSLVQEVVISSRVTRDRVDTQISWMLMRSILPLSSGKGKGSSSPRDGCFKCGGAHIQRDCTQEHKQAIVWQGQTEQVMVPRVRTKKRVKKTMENPKESPRCHRFTQG